MTTATIGGLTTHAPSTPGRASAAPKVRRRRGQRNLNPTVLPVLAFHAKDATAQGEACVLVGLSGTPAMRDLGGARMLLLREHWERLKEAGATCWTAHPMNGNRDYYVSSGARAAQRLAAGIAKKVVHLSRLIANWAGIPLPSGHVVRFRNGDTLDLRPGNLEVVRNGMQRGPHDREAPPRIIREH
ncbi:HNH endonuclease [Roseomonas gilardii]|uniref:HNH endonuclease n=1 Tax=Roseomonas gilardii TaxID=257708 RepID=UPI0011A63BE5